MDKFINYIKSTRAELKRVSWPTREQAIAYTAIVIVISLLIAAYLGLFDRIFSEVLNRLFL